MADKSTRGYPSIMTNVLVRMSAHLDQWAIAVPTSADASQRTRDSHNREWSNDAARSSGVHERRCRDNVATERRLASMTSVGRRDGSTIEGSALSRRAIPALTVFVPREGFASRCVNAVGNSERSRFGTDTRRDPAKTAVKLGEVKRGDASSRDYVRFSVLRKSATRTRELFILLSPLR